MDHSRMASRGRRKFDRYVPVSRHTIFVRRLPASVQPKALRTFFCDESKSNCDIEFVSYTDDKRKLAVALRFDSHTVAKEMLESFNNRDVLGYPVEITWFKDIQSAKERFESRRGGRYPRRGGGGGGRYRSGRSGSRGYGGRYRERRSRSDSRSSSTSSRSASETGSSGGRRRLSRGSIDKEEGSNRKRYSRDELRSPPRRRPWVNRRSASPPDVMSRKSWDREYKPKVSKSNTPVEKEIEKPVRQEPPMVIPEKPIGSNKDNFTHDLQWKSISSNAIEEPAQFNQTDISQYSNQTSSNLINKTIAHLDENLNKIKAKSEELLENFHLDIEKYLNFINIHVSNYPHNEDNLVDTLNTILTKLGENYVTQLVKYIENNGEGLNVSA